ncbi:MAG: winged helix DNA-binding protein [Phycisphaerae bacterium]|nr:winged helix DNA-binding protein [Phycisphaerae bacterium]
MPDKLGLMMAEFSGIVRRYRAWGMQKIEAIAGLSERDVAILEYVYSKKEATFAQIAQEMNYANMPNSSASTISQAISALYTKRGLVDKRLNPADQRQPLVTLTAKGEQAIEEVIKFRKIYLSQVRESMELSPEETAILENSLCRGIKNFEKLMQQNVL